MDGEQQKSNEEQIERELREKIASAAFGEFDYGEKHFWFYGIGISVMMTEADSERAEDTELHMFFFNDGRMISYGSFGDYRRECDFHEVITRTFELQHTTEEYDWKHSWEGFWHRFWSEYRERIEARQRQEIIDRMEDNYEYENLHCVAIHA